MILTCAKMNYCNVVLSQSIILSFQTLRLFDNIELEGWYVKCNDLHCMYGLFSFENWQILWCMAVFVLPIFPIIYSV